MYMHVDINGAYAAFECAMDPKLAKSPLIIASNNDATIIAMNRLAKNTGLKRGMPIFKCRDLIEQHHIAVRSSNFTLYEDYSNRFHETLEGFAEDTDRYSVDESFMLLKNMDKIVDFEEYGCLIRRTLLHNLRSPAGLEYRPRKRSQNYAPTPVSDGQQLVVWSSLQTHSELKNC
ncbi:hypothetical protein [Salmonella enterica]|uniref:Y-family DNA polymerase n=1 Tax=Salmonella enterica TaxID=28901 RepID=UPI002167EBE5|nr:hypothetical protein [Salmonella enterica]